MYTKLEFSLDILAVTAFAGPAGHSGQQEGSNILFPLSMTGSAELCKLPYKRLPQARVWLSAEVVEVTATPQHLQLLTSLSEQHNYQQVAISTAETSHQPQNQVDSSHSHLTSTWCHAALRIILGEGIKHCQRHMQVASRGVQCAGCSLAGAACQHGRSTGNVRRWRKPAGRRSRHPSRTARGPNQGRCGCLP